MSGMQSRSEVTLGRAMSITSIPLLPPPPPATAAAAAAATRWLTPIVPPAAKQVADLPALKQRLAELEQAAAAEDLWEQRVRAQAVLQQLNQLREEVAQLDRFSGQLDDLAVAVELLEMEVGWCWPGQWGLCEAVRVDPKDWRRPLAAGLSGLGAQLLLRSMQAGADDLLQALLPTCLHHVGIGAAAQEEAAVAAEAAGICDTLERALEGWELRRLLGGPYDARGAVLTIQVRRVGAGKGSSQAVQRALGCKFGSWPDADALAHSSGSLLPCGMQTSQPCLMQRLSAAAAAFPRLPRVAGWRGWHGCPGLGGDVGTHVSAVGRGAGPPHAGA